MPLVIVLSHLIIDIIDLTIYKVVLIVSEYVVELLK